MGYLQELRKVCTAHDVVLIYDEVQTGFGRCGTLYAADYYGAYPDIMVVSKAMASGFPLAVILTSDKYDILNPGDAAGTHRGHPLSCAAALATMDILEDEKLMENATKMGAYFQEGLREMAKTHEWIGEIRGVGLHIGVELVRDRITKEPIVAETRRILARAKEKGVILGMAGMGVQFDNSVVKIKPPLAITEEEADTVLRVFDECLREVS
jgi:4-aminobutyrate aminotransferase-like enzyme